MKIAYESLINYSLINATHIYVRIDLSNQNSVDNFMKHNLSKDKLPILFYPNDADIETVISAHEQALKKLTDYPITIALDDNSAILEYLSFRTNLSFEKKCLHIKKLFSHNISVILTVEELMPKGIDPYEGVMIAKFLASCGVKKNIASSGSKKFLLLYDRKKTTPKNQELEICEPKIACGLWLKEHTDLDIGVYVNYTDEEHEKHVIEQSKKLGYCEVIFNKT